MSGSPEPQASCGCTNFRRWSTSRKRRTTGWKSKPPQGFGADSLKQIDPSSALPEENQHPPAQAFPITEAIPPDADELYLEWYTYEMSLRFPRIDSTDLRDALRSNGGSLCRAYKAVAISYDDALKKEQNLPISEEDCKEQHTDNWPPPDGLRLLESSSCHLQKLPDTACLAFERDWATLQLDLPELLKDDQFVPPPQIIDCGCCCMEFHFEDMVQCAEGHLFCGSCLRRQVEELTFGGLQSCGRLPCMDTDGCNDFFPWSEIRRTIPKDLLIRFEQRQAADSVARARISRLEHCPFCDFVCEVDEGRIVFNCPNEHCCKASCVVCKEPDHSPLGCKEVEKPSDTSSRTKIEEVMSKALIRECSRCKAQIVKEDGCNKVTCRCGQSMCYICRKQVVTYEHFCAHPRTGTGCTHCKKSCHLHDKEDSKTVVSQAKGVALNALAWKDPGILARQIGPAEHISHKS